MNERNNAMARVLVMDDNRRIHDDFRKILCMERTGSTLLADQETALFGEPVRPVSGPWVEIEFALHGVEGLDKVRGAIQADRPFDVAFVDVRMPPGVNGIDVASRLWGLDPDIQVVICTAYSDVSWEEMCGRLGPSDRWVILKKPFDPVEVLQLTHAMVAKRRLLQQSRRRTEELTTANRELDAFAYSISHDLRAPLRHVAGFVELLKLSADGHLDERSARYVDIIGNSATEMGELIDDLLEFSRMGRSRLQPAEVDLGRVVADVIRTEDMERGGRHIDWRVGPLPHVMADRTMLKQVIVNLIGNAVKYTRPRDPAVIEVGAFDGMPATLDVPGVETGTEALAELAGRHWQPPEVPGAGVVVAGPGATTTVFVRDNGVGFDMQYVDRLFGVFHRLHSAEEFEGTGIGLANVRRIVARHGGKTWAEGKPGQGAVFYFSLPRGDPKGAAA